MSALSEAIARGQNAAQNPPPKPPQIVTCVGCQQQNRIPAEAIAARKRVNCAKCKQPLLLSTVSQALAALAAQHGPEEMFVGIQTWMENAGDQFGVVTDKVVAALDEVLSTVRDGGDDTEGE